MSAPAPSGRLRCLVPFCRRTIDAARFAALDLWPDPRWICGPQWRGVPARQKAVKRRVRRALRVRPGDPRLLGRFVTVSRRCTRAAIEAALQIGSAGIAA